LAIGALLVHIGVKLPIVRRALTHRRPDPTVSGTLTWRGLLAAVAGTAGMITARRENYPSHYLHRLAHTVRLTHTDLAYRDQIQGLLRLSPWGRNEPKSAADVGHLEEAVMSVGRCLAHAAPGDCLDQL
jgi:hypothetical protein